MAINLHCEQILCDLSRFDPPRFIRIAVPYATVPTGGSEGTTLLAVCVMLECVLCCSVCCDGVCVVMECVLCCSVYLK